MYIVSLGNNKNAMGAAEALSVFNYWTMEIKRVLIIYSSSLLPTVLIFFWPGLT